MIDLRARGPTVRSPGTRLADAAEARRSPVIPLRLRARVHLKAQSPAPINHQPRLPKDERRALSGPSSQTDSHDRTRRKQHQQAGEPEHQAFDGLTVHLAFAWLRASALMPHSDLLSAIVMACLLSTGSVGGAEKVGLQALTWNWADERVSVVGLDRTCGHAPGVDAFRAVKREATDLASGASQNEN